MGIASLFHLLFSGLPSKFGSGGMVLPVSFTKRLYAATVSLVRPIQKPLLIVT
jgi:hypothetical protein